MNGRYIRVVAPAGFDGIAKRREYCFKTKNSAAEFRLRIKRWKAEQKSPNDTLSFDDNDKRWLAYLRAHVGNFELLPEIVTHWEKTAKALTQTLTVAELVDRFTLYRKERKPKLGRATLGEDRFVTTRFVGLAGEVECHEVTPKLIQKFLDTATSDSIRRKLFKVASLLFDFARTEKAIVINPFEELERPEVPYVVPDILTPEGFAQRLRVADKDFPELLPFLAIAGFAGVRREEMLREYRDDQILDWSDILWKKRLIEIRSEVAKKTKRKTGDRRFIPMEGALVHWLEPYRKDSGPVVELADSWFRKRFALLLQAVEQEAAKNELRHSYASYWLARSKKEGLGRLALAMGNSEAVVRRHYLESLTPQEGRAWFVIRRNSQKKPKKVSAGVPDRPKVVPFPLAQSA
jgi:hypothetical protein